MNFFKDKLYLELIIAGVLFVIALWTNTLMKSIIYMLYFIIFLEIVRTVVNYIREERVSLNLLVDAFIILALREFIVNVVKINDSSLHDVDTLFSHPTTYNLIILSVVILFLLFVRYLSIKSSQRYLLKEDKEKNEEK